MDRALHATHILYLNPQIGVYLDSQALGRTRKSFKKNNLLRIIWNVWKELIIIVRWSFLDKIKYDLPKIAYLKFWNLGRYIVF